MIGGRHLDSLRFRVTLSLLIPLVLTLAFFGYLEYTDHRRLLMESLHSSVTNTGEIIEGSLLKAMVDNDFSTVQQIVSDIARQPEVVNVFLLDKEGYIILASDQELVGQRIDLDNATCQACHRYQATRGNESIVLAGAAGRAIFRNVNALENKSECQDCHSAQTELTGVLISDFSMAGIDNHLAALRQSRLLWSGISILVTLVIVNLTMSRFVVTRIEQLVGAVGRISRGDLNTHVATGSPDEIGILAESFNRMTDGLKEKEALERNLQERTRELQTQAIKLSTLNTLAATVSQSLDLDDILHSALDKVLELLGLEAGWVMLGDGQDGDLRLAASHGMPQGMMEMRGPCSWQDYYCSAVLHQGLPRVCQELPQDPCPIADQLLRVGLVVRACIPIKAKDHILGVMGLTAGSDGEVRGLGGDDLELLVAIGQQIGIAVENASLYEELRQKEAIRRQLLERLISVQEAERKRIALELHDQTGQPLTSLLMTLEVMESSSSLAEAQAHIRELQATAADVMERVHHLALELRPRILDDLGLPSAVRHYCREYQDKFRLPVDFQVLGFEQSRLPPTVETALYRILQEALTNVARHAHASSVSVLLETRGDSVVLIVEDDGLGFELEQTQHSRSQGMHLGLYSMQERASLLGGKVTIESTPVSGTAVFVEIPVVREGEQS